MSLLEILVKELWFWPEDVQRIYQLYNGDVMGVAGFGYTRFIENMERADDYETAVVTKSKWKKMRWGDNV